MRSLFPLKGSPLASFFVFLLLALCVNFVCTGLAQAQSLPSSRERAHQLNLAHNPSWMSLLHYSQGQSHIDDPSFILTASHFSLDAELDATINLFYEKNAQDALCRFPARYFWLNQYIQLPALSYDSCGDLHEFEQKAPADSISVIYVSENIAQPSSMMGHLFLKISGVNARSDRVDHAVSFYTDAKTLNVPKLIYDSMIKGKRGYFTLSPYAEKVNSYVHDEQRNLWELDLQLSDQQRRLIQLHLYELKQTEFKYFFQHYNCATVIGFIASLAIPELREPEVVWVTPLDIAKLINNSNKISAARVQTSNRWRLRMLQTQLPDQLSLGIKQSVDGEFRSLPPVSTETQAFLALEMAHAYNDYRLEKKIVDVAEWQGKNSQLSVFENLALQHTLDLTEFKSPLKTPPDSQWWIGVTSRQDQWFLRTGILPASHLLEDDNRQYFGETGLHLAQLSLLTNLATGSTRLENFELYSAESLMPYDRFTGGVSGKFSIGVAPVYDQDMHAKQQTYVKGALGYTYSLGVDLDVYALAGLGVGFANRSAYLFAIPEAGLVLREVFDMKSIVAVSQAYNYLGESQRLTELSFTQAKYFNNNYAIFFHAKRSGNTDAAVNAYDLTLKKYF